MAPPNKDELIAQFCAFTNAPPSEAENALGAHDWDVEAAVATWFASDRPGDEHASDDDDQDTAPPNVPGGGRTLGGDGVASRYVPPTAGRSTAASAPRSAGPPTRAGRGGMRTLRDLQGDSHAGHGHDDEDDEEQDLFAGGEKSGLAVQNPGSNPRDQIEHMLERARRNIPRPGGDEDEAPRSRFTGRGVTLGGEGTESRIIEDPRANAPRPPPRVQRVLHLWSDGFSVDDGPLFRYDDPANAATLAMINQGRAPLELLNVEHNQEVDLQLDNQKDTKFVQPKKKYKPFEGRGQRLGSPTPGAASLASAPASSLSASRPGTSSHASTAGAGASAPTINDSQPTVTLQVRLGDGTTLRSRFNTTHTVGDVYRFVEASSPQQRPFALMTTFPSKELTDHSAVLGEMAEFKRGGVVVQKWT
ncbi:uncharacterized protein PV09_02244 [Verruconis gallopava]|uniref:UBX domain-containing protein n=1 Tax=Verruconis gallopava TaxID=253628 RepID=A0A0D1XX97_9PEZI|nr:uncharacterized protein PV09_02244 [Verruconis gallopava]KIW07401.1 hypothetical protein PV09_02244 [Verruconis gallopava]